jgi:hypothetical protein
MREEGQLDTVPIVVFPWDSFGMLAIIASVTLILAIIITVEQKYYCKNIMELNVFKVCVYISFVPPSLPPFIVMIKHIIELIYILNYFKKILNKVMQFM